MILDSRLQNAFWEKAEYSTYLIHNFKYIIIDYRNNGI